jgi:FkbM family methyltransferase
MLKSLAKQIVPNAVQRAYRTCLLEWERSRFTRHIVERRLGGQQVRIELVDSKGQRWYDRDMEFDPEVRLLACHRLTSGARVFNLGAHQGIVAMALAQHCGPNGSVIALEPSLFDAQAARRNHDLNGFSQITVVQKAIASQCGTIEFQASGRVNYFGGATKPTSVPATTIDALAKEFGMPSVLFIDVDGFEVEALYGALEVFATRPDCYIEVHPPYLKNYGRHGEDVIRFFDNKDYYLLASQQMKSRLRTFQPLDDANIDYRTFFHLVAIAE